MLSSLADMLQEATHWLLQWCCHQEPSRLLHIGGHALQLCPRCSGLHAGFLFGVTVMRYWYMKVPPSGRSTAMLVLLGATTGVHWMLDAGGMLASAGQERLVTGLLSGFGGGGLFALYQLRRDGASPALPGAASSGLLLLSSAGISLLIVDSGSAYVVLSAAAVLTVGANVVTVLGTLLVRAFPRLHRDTTHLTAEVRHETLHS